MKQVVSGTCGFSYKIQIPSSDYSSAFKTVIGALS